LVLSFLSAVVAAAINRADYQDYLTSVYALSNFSKLSDPDLYALYDNLTFYYEDNPAFTSGQRDNSINYAGTTCDCLHIQLPACIPAKPPSFPGCELWNCTTYLNMEWLHDQAFIPDNAWFEGLTFVGEWGFPVSCTDPRWMRKVYGWNRHIWLYPTKGLGYWFNAGKTAAAYNKVAWLIKFGQGTLGNNKTEIMDYLAETSCPNYKNVTSGCTICPNPTTKGLCCCHGAGRNLGIQISDYKYEYRVTWQQALSDVADMYITGMFGEDGGQSYYWPNGTYFGYVNLLDDDILDLQDKFSYQTAQFLREPQHTLVGVEFSEPVYAFEVLTNYDYSVSSWSDFCRGDGKLFGVTDPLQQMSTFMSQGYLTSGTFKSIKNWVPRPGFMAQFTGQVALNGGVFTGRVDNTNHGRY